MALLTGLYLLAVAGDWSPYLRGADDWRWFLLDWPPAWRLLPLLAAGAAYLAVVLFWDQCAAPGRAMALRLAILAGSAVLLQLAALWVRYPQPLRYIFDLAASDSINGYYTVAVGIQDVGAFLQSYPALMPTLPNHVTTHPPGLPLLFWATGQLVNLVPVWARGLGQAFRLLGCMHNWLVLVADDANLAGGLFAYVIPLLGALTVFPLYGLGQRLYGARAAWRAAALFPLLPAFVMNVGQADQMYPLFVTLAGRLFDRGLRERRGWPMLSAGVVLSLASFLSLGLVAFLLLLGMYTLILLARGVVRPDKKWWGGLALFALGLASAWLLYGAAAGVNPLDIWRAGLGKHVGLERPYGRWLIFNLVDFLPFSGLALVLALPLGLARLLRRPGEGWLPAVLLTVLVLDLSGVTRGEVSRLWLFLTPALTLACAASLTVWEETGSPPASPWGLRLVGGLLLAQLAVFGALVTDPHPPLDEMRVPAQVVPPLSYPTDARFGGLLRLAGYELSATQVAPGGQVALTLYWQTLARPARAYKVFTHLYNAQTGVMAGQRDKLPLSGDWLMTCWNVGEVYSDTFRIAVAGDAPPGEYSLETGFYDEFTGQRLPVEAPGGLPDGRLVLTTVEVRP